jgi:hypothetical protein
MCPRSGLECPIRFPPSTDEPQSTNAKRINVQFLMVSIPSSVRFEPSRHMLASCRATLRASAELYHGGCAQARTDAHTRRRPDNCFNIAITLLERVVSVIARGVNNDHMR